MTAPLYPRALSARGAFVVVSRLPEDLAAYPTPVSCRSFVRSRLCSAWPSVAARSSTSPWWASRAATARPSSRNGSTSCSRRRKPSHARPAATTPKSGVPLSVGGLNEQSEVGLFEAGISQCGEMDALQSIIQPTVGCSLAWARRTVRISVRRSRSAWRS